MKREYYSDSIPNFIFASEDEVLGKLSGNSSFDDTVEQKYAWREEIRILKQTLIGLDGGILLEYSIPRMGRRIDAVIIIRNVVFVLEFKIGEREFTSHAIDQVCDYALDLKYFHQPSHNVCIAPILVATGSTHDSPVVILQKDELFKPIKANEKTLPQTIKSVLESANGGPIDVNQWREGRYCPTPTIVEAALALYRGHNVKDISRSDAGATNLTETSETLEGIIRYSKKHHQKSICFVTGVPGAGKTLVGLNIANNYSDETNDLHSVFLSGNGPLVSILREALTRDKVRQERERGIKLTKSQAMREVKVRIQNVHNFRDDCLSDPKPPHEHVAIFDEAQRAWTLEQTKNFMNRRKATPDFKHSEPAFLISCMDRHQDWAVIVCLVGGGQEINTGEAGIGEWIRSLGSFPDWKIYLSPKLTDSEYSVDAELESLKSQSNVEYEEKLHLSVSMRSFRAERVSLLVKQLLDIQPDESKGTLAKIAEKYPIVITRDLNKAKTWLKSKARGSERYGIVVSSQAIRLKPYAIDVKSPTDPVHWFLDGKDDIRSSYYLEDVATEFQVQGLELDWACVTWDADFRRGTNGWEHRSFCGSRWNSIKMATRQNYLKNAYRVLLTRARQGMVVVVPEGDEQDPTRKPEYYDSTYQYLADIGFKSI